MITQRFNAPPPCLPAATTLNVAVALVVPPVPVQAKT